MLPNANYANSADELIAVMRQQFKEGADFIKIYETGADSVRDGKFSTPYQYTEAQLEAAVKEAARLGKRVAVHATGEPGTLFAAQAGVASIDHANQLSDETMRLMKEKQIFAVPTFTIFEYFADHAATPAQAAHEHQMLDIKVQEFKKQIAAGVPMAVGSDVGPFPHGAQARELILMVKYGMSPLAVLQADLLNGAKLLGWDGQIGALEPGYLADSNCGRWRSAARHWSAAERSVRNERRHGLQKVSRLDLITKSNRQKVQTNAQSRAFSSEAQTKLLIISSYRGFPVSGTRASNCPSLSATPVSAGTYDLPKII